MYIWTANVHFAALMATYPARETIERLFLRLCNKENSNESDTKNEECDKAYMSDEGSITIENTDNPHEKQENKERGSIEIDEFGDSNDDSLRGTSSTISNLGNDDAVSKIWNEQLDEINNNKTLADMNTTTLLKISRKKIMI
ncbi:hypothetical protein RDI58_029005 [Solanum bulbocastanum]|uniref:Uncharacterized protein n=1 Tax=Solanum bulbocastanum TaxID=147425 RepID=A0AAN8STM0_SOLBU